MRLRSSFHDYYDTVLAEGHDSAITYLRFPQEVELDSFPFSTSGIWGSKLSIRTHVIGFCDKIRYVLEVNFSGSSGNFKDDRDRRRYCYSVEDVDSFVRANFKEREIGEFYLKKSRHYRGESRDVFANFFEVCGREVATRTKISEYFKDHPIFVASSRNYYGEKSKIVYNAPLKPFEFYRIYDAYTAFQELSMWLGNKAVPMKPLPVMSDAIKIGARGFDKFSFRKEPTKKK